MSNMTLQLDIFEGPLDLLLYLIKKNDLEISRISISDVTGQYLEYLEELKEIDIDAASDFLFMAAELAHIKSRTLLPKSEIEGEEEEDEVANDLIARLREYERYKMAAKELKERNWLDRDVFTRGSFFEVENEDHKPQKEKKTTENGDEFFEVDTFELIQAFHDVLNRIPKEDPKHKVLSERVSVTERIYEVLDELKKADSILFTDIFKGDYQKIDLVVSFLAILEMGKLKLVRIYQTSIFAPIRLQRRVDVDVSEKLPDRESLDEMDDYR